MKHELEQLISKAVSQVFGPDVASKVVFSVSYPPKPEMGDYATNVAMVLAKQVGQSPAAVAEVLIAKISDFRFQISDSPEDKEFSSFNLQSAISNLQFLGGFINFTITSEVWFKEVVEEIEKSENSYGVSKVVNPEKIMVEYLSPNTNKPLHLGHLRNGVTGVATINTLKAQGHEVTRVGIINDRGVHISKAMLAYERWGNGATPESTGKKPDHFVGDWYVRFAQEAAKDPALEMQAQEMLQKWEAGDIEIRRLWKTIRDWVIAGWKPTEETLGFSYDKVYFESDVFQLGKDIVEQGLQKGVFRKNEKGNVLFDLPEKEFGKDEQGQSRVITMLRPDGTSLYTTQDLGLAVTRAEEYHLDRLVYVVGSEQRFHFEGLFAMLKALGYAWASKLHHLWYGMVYLPDGKMKSREGTVVDADDLVLQMIDLAKQEIESRQLGLGASTFAKAMVDKKDAVDSEILQSKISNLQSEIERRAKVIGIGAIKFYLLKQKPTVDIHFNPEESISFEGFTGPYCQYAYARARSILRQGARVKGIGDSQRINYSLLGDIEERALLQKLESFPEVIGRAAAEYNVALVATHVFETAQAFNTFYTTHPVLKADSIEQAVARMKLVETSAQVIKNGLALLGIEVLEEM